MTEKRTHIPHNILDPEAVEKWIRENAFFCVRLEAKITKAACASYRMGCKLPGSGVVIVPKTCRECQEYPEDAKPLKKERRTFKEGVRRGL